MRFKNNKIGISIILILISVVMIICIIYSNDALKEKQSLDSEINVVEFDNSNEENKELEEIIEGASSKELYQNSCMYSMSDFSKFLKGYEKDNLYAKKFNEEFEKISDKNDFEMDFVAFFSHILTEDNLYYQGKLQRIKKIWKVGYNEENNILNNNLVVKYDSNNKLIDDLNYRNVRSIVILVDGQENEDYFIYGSIYAYVCNGKVKFPCSPQAVPLDAKYVGIDINSEQGIFKHKTPNYDSEWNGLPYESIRIEEIQSILSKYESMVNLYDMYGKFKYVKPPKEEKEKVEPKIGMTKTEVLNSTWGEPKKKNITESRYGNNEQWVYSSDRYIYFENGIVTSIQKSE